MSSFCPQCGVERQGDHPFCASCGARLDAAQPRQRRGGHGGTGLLLAVLGGAWLFVPFWPSSIGNLSLWQGHDACSSLIGAFAPSDCSKVNLLWAIGLGLIGLGVITALGAALRSESPEPPTKARR